MTHFQFIAWAYGLSAAGLVGLTLFVWFNLRRQARRLAELEARGLPRRRSPKTALT